jgi:hypothetical protein
MRGPDERAPKRAVVRLDVRFEPRPARKSLLARDDELRMVQRQALRIRGGGSGGGDGGGCGGGGGGIAALSRQPRESAQRARIARARGLQQRTRLLALVLEIELQRLWTPLFGCDGHGWR